MVRGRANEGDDFGVLRRWHGWRAHKTSNQRVWVEHVGRWIMSNIISTLGLMKKIQMISRISQVTEMRDPVSRRYKTSLLATKFFK
jgi:hypothetical protein